MSVQPNVDSPVIFPSTTTRPVSPAWSTTFSIDMLAAYAPGRVGVSTAVYLEGFTDALALARQRGDRRRSTRYEAVVRAAARYVLQLMVRPEECYYIGTPKDAVGGIRTTLTNHRLRIDHVQHALFALIKSREVLFGKRGPRQ